MQRSALCRSRRELSNVYLLAKSGFDTAENEPAGALLGISPDGRGLLVRLVAADGPLAGGKKPFAQTKNGLISSRLACTLSKAKILTKQSRNLDFNPEYST